MKRHSLSILILSVWVFFISSCSNVELINKHASNNLQAPAQMAPTPTPVNITSEEVIGAMSAIQAGFSDIYTRVAPSVVNIQVESSHQIDVPSFPQFPWSPFQAPDSQQPHEYRQSGLGSGFIWDQEGHIVTNNHVVENADQITVTFADGSSAEAEMIGNDPDSDLAVIKVAVPAAQLAPVTLADSTQAQVGQLVAAIGNPFGLEGTMTVGIISALGRSLPVEADLSQGASYTIPDVIQTDAPINPGNSGGVLVDMDGQLVGVTTAIESPVRANAGIGFVIPSIIVQRVVPELISTGYFDHPFIGISGTTLTADLAEAMNLDRNQRGVLVINIVPDSPAEDAGLAGSDLTKTIDGRDMRIGGDIIVQIDDIPVNDFEDLTAYLTRYTEANQSISLGILRNGEPETVSLTLGVRPTGEETQQALARGDQQTNGKAFLGILGTDLTPEISDAMNLDAKQEGVLIQQVIEGSAADKAGLHGSYKSITINGQNVLIGGDVIVALDENPITGIEALQSSLSRYEAGDRISLTIIRENTQLTIEVELQSR